ncbi:MAG: RNA polymerase sigma factor [Steroidobacteraceae bacterium]
MGKPLGEIKRFPRSGGADAFFDQLCRAHEAQLLAYLTQMLGRVDLAREAIQDTYEQLHRMYRPEQVLFPRAILFKVATRYALMQLRRRRVESAMIGGPAGMEQVPDLRGEPERQVMAEQIEQRVAQVIGELPAALRTVFVLAHVQGESRKRIAQRLGISERRVDKRMTRALKQCRLRLSMQGIDLAEVD